MSLIDALEALVRDADEARAGYQSSVLHVVVNLVVPVVIGVFVAFCTALLQTLRRKRHGPSSDTDA